jgi:hypothetical protein
MLFAAVSGVGLTGCSSAGGASENPVEDVDSVASAFVISNIYLDGQSPFGASGDVGLPVTVAHQCNANVGNTLVAFHCCMNGFAMIGARVDYNVFKCGIVNGGLSGSKYASSSCGADLMVGYNQSFGQMLCQHSPELAQKGGVGFLDPGTQDAWPMHVCPTNRVMGEIASTGDFRCWASFP